MRLIESTFELTKTTTGLAFHSGFLGAVSAIGAIQLLFKQP
jgi:hypothetical protein